MSRIGKQPIAIPKGVQVTVNGQAVSVKGAKATLTREVHQDIGIKVEGEKVLLTPKSTGEAARKFHGLSRTLVNNMVVGVTTGFTKRLKLVGVGYKAATAGKNLTLNLGYSHAINFEAPAGIELKVDGPTIVIVNGADKELVGQVAAKIRSFRAPEPYHGKGVRYEDERIATKVGKSAGKK
jgi:large subunit ribosomal protein L6